MKKLHPYRSALLQLVVILLLPLSGCAPAAYAQIASDTTPPLINVWYGDHQVFGSQGLPQKWVNILGNIGDPESGVRTVGYSLNGASDTRLALGPDNRRLLKPGDFNIEIDINTLVEGENHLEISATNQNNLQTRTAVEVEFTRHTWPLPYSIDWKQVKQAQDVLQIVDGKWAWDENGIRPLEIGYDRVLAIGDMDWTNYEVTLRITLHGIDPHSYSYGKTSGAGFGINLHWLGHTDVPVKCNWPIEPHCGWEPTGASNWYSFKQSGVDTLAIEAGPPESIQPVTDHKLQFGHTYILEASTLTHPAENEYFFKLWEPGAQAEPTQWTLTRATGQGYGDQKNLGMGSFLIVLHRVDATIGNITVAPVADEPK